MLNIFWKACTHLIITLREASSWLIKPFYNVFKTFQENVFHESATDLYATSYKRFFWSFFRRLDLTEKRRFLWTLFAKSCKTRCLVHKKTFSWCQQRRWNGSDYIKFYYILLPQPPQQQRRWNGSNYIKLYYILLSLLRISSDSFPEEGRNNIRNMVVDIFHKPTSNFQVDQNISIRRSFFIR